MKRIRNIAAAIIAILAVLLSGTPTQAASGIPVGESDAIIYGNESEMEIWSVVIFNAGTPKMAKQMYAKTDRAFVLETTDNLFTSVGRAETIDDETLGILGADAATFYDADSQMGAGVVIVAYAGDHLYMFMAVGIDDFEDFAGWQIEVIAAETFVGVDVPRGFIAVED